jgi:hypothetical protein
MFPETVPPIRYLQLPSCRRVPAFQRIWAISRPAFSGLNEHWMMATIDSRRLSPKTIAKNANHTYLVLWYSPVDRIYFFYRFLSISVHSFLGKSPVPIWSYPAGSCLIILHRSSPSLLWWKLKFEAFSPQPVMQSWWHTVRLKNR